MNRLATCAAAIAALVVGVPAFAADMPMKAPLPAPTPVYNWTGWYAGVNLGASFGHVKTDFNAPITVTANAGGGPGSATASFASSSITEPSGFIGGGQIGYNWQYSPIIVVGLEADFQGADERDRINTIPGSFSLAVNGPGFGLGIGGPTAGAYETKIDWFGTVRGRIGYVWGDGAVLTYLTGGLAYGKVDVEGTSTITVPGFTSVTSAAGHSQVNTGWTIGSGTEGKLLIPGWTYKIEYLYMDLGTLDATGSGSATGTAGALTVNLTGLLTTHSHFTDNIVRVGLNYQFH